MYAARIAKLAVCKFMRLGLSVIQGAPHKNRPSLTFLIRVSILYNKIPIKVLRILVVHVARK